MENSTKKIDYLSYIKTGLFYLVAGILVLYIAISVFMPEKTVKVFGFNPYVVITNSMEPYIDVNDLIFVKNAKVDELVVEDIITFYADVNYDGKKEIVTHYIYSITDGVDGKLVFRTHRYYENAADVSPDGWVLGEDDILGQYMFKIPKVGAVILFIKSPFGIAALLVNAGVIGGIVYLVKKGEVKVEEKKEDKVD